MVTGKGKGKGAKSGKGGKAADAREDKGDLNKLLASGGSPRRGRGKGNKSGSASATAAAASSSEDINAAKTVQEIEASLLIESISQKRGARGEDGEKRQGSSKQNLEARGSHCEVRKHSDMGCAVVTMESAVAREVVLKLAAERTQHNPAGDGEKEKRPQVVIGEFTIQMRPHFDKTNQVDVKTDIFVAWGRQNEKRSPLAASAIAEAFDTLFREAQPSAAQVYGQQQMAMAMHPQMFQPVMGTNQMMPHGMMQAVPYMAMPAQHYSLMPGTPQAAVAPMVPQQHVAVPPQAGHLPATSSPSEARDLVQSQPQPATAAPQPGEANTPPASAEDGANSLRADAPAFTFTPPQNSAGTGTGTAYSSYDYGDTSNYVPTPERKAMTIVDPKSGQPIKMDPPKLLPEFEVPKATAYRPLSIIDPANGSKVDTMGMNFTPPKTAKLSIIDPTCGATIKA